MEFDWINIEEVDDALLKEFDSGNESFNFFLRTKAKTWQSQGETVTYVFVDKSEIISGSYSRVYGYISINTLGLLYYDGNSKKYLSCAEIRMFAIAKQLRKHHDSSITWSEMLFKVALQNLYFMSVHTIGFRAIFLNANHDGYELYKNIGFEEIEEFIPPDEEKGIDIQGCVPLLLVMGDEMLYNIFL